MAGKFTNVYSGRPYGYRHWLGDTHGCGCCSNSMVEITYESITEHVELLKKELKHAEMVQRKLKKKELTKLGNSLKNKNEKR